MNANKIFWGLCFVVIGGLFLLDNLHFLSVDWWSLARFWPIILVFWGISLLVSGESPRWYTVLFVIIFGFVIVALYQVAGWFQRQDMEEGVTTYVQTLTQPWDATIDRAKLTFQSGAGRFVISQESPELIEAKTNSSFGKYELDRRRSGGREDLWLELKKARFRWMFGRSKNSVEVKLNATPVWDIDLSVGAASVDFDLSRFKTGRVRFEGGAASVRIRLGDLAEESRVRVEAGVSSIRIEVPSNSGCEINVSAPLTRKRFPDFDKIESGLYRTPNFDAASHRIYIDVEAGVSSLRVTRF